MVINAQPKAINSKSCKAHRKKFHVLSSGSFAAYPIKHCTTLQYCGKKKANYY